MNESLRVPTSDLKVCLVAAPLMARSGVYRSLTDLVESAREMGLHWSGLIGLRPDAAGESTSSEFVTERKIVRSGLQVIPEVRRLVRSTPSAMEADVLVSMISQTDWVMASGAVPGKPWFAFVRGLPWPDKGEQSALRRIVLYSLERLSLRRASDVWVTTTVLQTQVSRKHPPTIVPAGIPGAPRVSFGTGKEVRLMWAGRLDGDKRPEMFVRLAQSLGLPAALAGSGPLEERLRRESPRNVQWLGWVPPRELWAEGDIFVGTSSREAFGRSAAEAAQAGVPVILGEQYGVAERLYTDPELRRRFVISGSDEQRWLEAIKALAVDPALRQHVSEHVFQNALELTISASVNAVVGRLEVAS